MRPYNPAPTWGPVWANPLSLAATYGISFDFSSSRYLDVSVPWVGSDLSVTGLQPAGFPHSDIHGSKPACGSPWLFAACHVLLRLSAPRHPPCALTTLGQYPTKVTRSSSNPASLRVGPHLIRTHQHTWLSTPLRKCCTTCFLGARFGSNSSGQKIRRVLTLVALFHARLAAHTGRPPRTSKSARSFQTRIVNHQSLSGAFISAPSGSLCPVLLLHSHRAAKDNKIRISVNRLSPVGQHPFEAGETRIKRSPSGP